jgi:hypothetical protein
MLAAAAVPAAVPVPAAALLVAAVLGGGVGAFVAGGRDKGDAREVAVVQPARETPPVVPSGSVVPSGPVVASVPVKSSTPGVGSTPVEAPAPEGSAQTSTRLASVPAAAAQSPSRVAADRSTPSPSSRGSSSPSSPAGAEPGSGRLSHDGDALEVAEWSSGGQRIEAVPEGPPSISRVEYVIDWVDARGGRVEQLPASAIVGNGKVTF